MTGASAREPAPRVILLSRPQDQAGDAAGFAYRRVLRCIREAQNTLEIHMYVWRADAVGHLIGQAVYEAAERGIRIKILKDTGAVLYESQEANRKSFFRSPRPWPRRIRHRLIGLTLPDSRVRDAWNQTLGDRLMAHPRVDIQWVAPTHTKYYCIDESIFITGSLNLEDRHRGYHDVMVEIRDEDAVRHIRRVQCDPAAPPARETLCVLMNHPEHGSFAIKPAVLGMIDQARDSLYIEMAYVGDEDVTRALIEAGRRGVRLSMLFSAKANIGNDANYRTLRQLLQSTPIEVRLSPKMIHSKLMIADRSKILLGSANLSLFSMRRAGELSLLVEGEAAFRQQMLSVVEARWQLGVPVSGLRDLPRTNRVLAGMQHWHQRLSSHS